jgi:Fe-coproporphyrin III synthase
MVFLKKFFQRFLYEIKRLITKKPFIAEIDITDRCNLRCRHCYHFQEKGNIAENEEPSLGKWKERFNELRAKGIRMIMLMGGEPMLRPDVVQLADEMFPLVEMITNGTIPVPQNYSHRIFVSIDGLKETNDRIRGNGVFDKVVKNFSGDKRVVFNMTLTAENYKELEDVVKLSVKTGVTGVVCNIYTALSSDDPESVTLNIRKNILDELKRVKKVYPGRLLFTGGALDWFEKADHRNYCYWSENVLHYDTSWNPRPCFAVADCSNCGCFAGAMGSPLGSVKQFLGLIVLTIKILVRKIRKIAGNRSQ